jgi:hypothetical protein
VVGVAPCWRRDYLTHIFIPLVIVITMIAVAAFHVPVTRSEFQFVELSAGEFEDRTKTANSHLIITINIFRV